MKKKILSGIITMTICLSAIVVPSRAYATSNEAYQGVFMKDGIFIYVTLYSGIEPGDSIGVVNHVTEPYMGNYGYVECNTYQELGEIYQNGGKYIIKSEYNDEYGYIEFKKGSICISNEIIDFYNGEYIQISNSGANMSPNMIWLDIPEIHREEIVSSYISIIEGYDWWRSNYTVYDIDKDGIKELITLSEYGYDVFTYKDNEAVFLYNTDYNGMDILEDCEWCCTIDYSLLDGLHIEKPIKVILNGTELSFDQLPIIQNSRTLVPLRAIFEAMGATVDWDGDTQTVISTLFGTTVKLTIGSNILYRNDEAKTLDVPAQIVNNHTMVPARAVAEAFGANVDWDGDTQTVYITTSGNNYTVNTVPEIIFDGFNSNFADFNGMYIDSFSHYTDSNGSENVKFDVYNTNYIYGVVEVFERNGKLSDVAIIDKMSNSTSIKGVLIDDTGKLIKDLFTGNVLTYKQESGYSKKTSISIDIPKGGYIKITNDMSESLVASLINLSDMVLNAKKTYSSLKGFNSETSKEYAQELSLKLIKDVAFSEMLNNPTTYSDDLWKGVADKLYMNSESIGGFIDTISKNLDELADGEFTELMLSTAGNCGISVAEGTFEALAGPAGVALKGFFALTSVTDAITEMNDGVNCMYQGSIKIQDTK